MLSFSNNDLVSERGFDKRDQTESVVENSLPLSLTHSDIESSSSNLTTREGVWGGGGLIKLCDQNSRKSSSGQVNRVCFNSLPSFLSNSSNTPTKRLNKISMFGCCSRERKVLNLSPPPSERKHTNQHSQPQHELEPEPWNIKSFVCNQESITQIGLRKRDCGNSILTLLLLPPTRPSKPTRTRTEQQQRSFHPQTDKCCEPELQFINSTKDEKCTKRDQSTNPHTQKQVTKFELSMLHPPHKRFGSEGLSHQQEKKWD